jgi:hypothetical protein
MKLLSFKLIVLISVSLMIFAGAAHSEKKEELCRATSESISAAMKSQFAGWFIAYNNGADSYGVHTVPLCARIHPFDVSQANLSDHVPSFCEEDAHGFYDWLCFFDTTYSLQNNWSYHVTRGEVAEAKENTVMNLWIGGPFIAPPSDVSDFVFNSGSYPDEEPTTKLEPECGPIKKFNGGIVYNSSVPGLPEQFQIERSNTFTYNCGIIFDQFELTPGFWTFRLQICSDIPIRPGAPTKNSSLGGNDGWDNVRAETETTCWWDRSMVIEIKPLQDSPEQCCGCQ